MTVIFWVLAPLAVLAALGLVFSRRAVHGALLLAFDMLCLAVFYIVQGAAFLGVVQIVVYTGAVMMLFLFVLMLVGVDASDSLVETIRNQRWLALVIAVVFGVLVVTMTSQAVIGTTRGLSQANRDGNVQGVANLIFNRYVFAFEATSALLITAALGAMILAHRERQRPKLTQRELSEARFRDGRQVTPLPSPGVYARHNAVDTPALAPDGSIIESSVSRILLARGSQKDPGPVAGTAIAVEAAVEEHADIEPDLGEER
jgi:NADH-quinone oxidoreductase subunit J